MVGRRVEGMVAARYVRPLWATLVGLALVCGSAPVARPCTTLECPELIVIPRDGGVVPANLPGLRLMLVANPLSTDLTRAEEGLPLEEVSLRVQDESGRIVPVEQDGPTFFFVEPLEAHRRYEVSISAPFSCSWHQTTAFETVDAAPLPEALGTVVGREITVTDYEENECSAAQRVRERRVELMLDPSVQPWADALAIRFFVRGQPIVGRVFANADRASAGSERAFSQEFSYECDEPDRFTPVPGGEQPTQVGGVIPGAWGGKTDPVFVNYDCNAPWGCRGAPADRAGILLLLAAGIALWRRRSPR